MKSTQLGLFTLDTPSMPILDTNRCYARRINYETAARMVETHHYAHRVPNIVVAVGMYVDDILAGCVTCGIPASRFSLSCCGNEQIEHCLELNRLYIHDWAGHNSESWLIGQLFSHMPEKYHILVSYADPKHNHIGYIYQATNWLYTGRGAQGGPEEKIVDGHRHHAKHIYNLFGTQDSKILRQQGHTVVDIPRVPKHRYIYLLGSRRQRRALKQALKWPILPYPKG